jgi:hypothetical protein
MVLLSVTSPIVPEIRPEEDEMSAPDKDPSFRSFHTLSDQLLGRNLNAAVAQIGMAALALAALYAAGRLLGWLP